MKATFCAVLLRGALSAQDRITNEVRHELVMLPRSMEAASRWWVKSLAPL
jgi:hypothetical protein